MSEKDKATLDLLVDILQGDKDISETDKILQPVTHFHLDHYDFNATVEQWKAWYLAIRPDAEFQDFGALP